MSNDIVIDRQRCDGCGNCVKTCPQIVYTQAAEKAIPEAMSSTRCFGCMACEEDCPKDAIRILRLPGGMTRADLPSPAAHIDLERLHDLVIVGAGPAGLGAAIRARQLGLEVVVLERLPSRARAHHPDGGLLFPTKETYLISKRGPGLTIDGLDVTLPASLVRDRLDDFAFMGPSGQTTRRGRASRRILMVDKNRLVESLAHEAEARGAKIAYNTRVSRLVVNAEGFTQGAVVDGERMVRGRMVISAEGITGRLAARAGAPVNESTCGWCYGSLCEYEPLEKVSGDAGFMLGALGGAEPGSRWFGYWSSTPTMSHFSCGPIYARKFRELSRPLTDYHANLLGFDSRLGAHLGKLPRAEAVRDLDGCRIRMRRLPRSAVGHGLIAAGDALTTCGMLTNLLALKTGDLAAQVAHRALARGDVSRAALAEFDRCVLRLQQVKGMRWMHNVMFEATLGLTPEKLDELYTLMSGLEVGAMMTGKIWPVLRFYLGLGWKLWRRPDLAKYLK